MRQAVRFLERTRLLIRRGRTPLTLLADLSLHSIAILRTRSTVSYFRHYDTQRYLIEEPNRLARRVSNNDAAELVLEEKLTN